MGLTYYFKFRAPAETDAKALMDFLAAVEEQAKQMGFGPTALVDAVFDTDERRNFSRRLTTGLPVEDLRLRNARLQPTPHVYAHDPVSGSCRIMPVRGLVLILTNERGIESVFGFFQYARTIKDAAGNDLMPLPGGEDWLFSDHMKTPDSRYRAIVSRFREAGYVVAEHDDYAVKA